MDQSLNARHQKPDATTLKTFCFVQDTTWENGCCNYLDINIKISITVFLSLLKIKIHFFNQVRNNILFKIINC